MHIKKKLKTIYHSCIAAKNFFVFVFQRYVEESPGTKLKKKNHERLVKS
jgi:hypothetical protein